ncbi:hypothetical protein, partial [uncultured Streptococcus sp.]|uniref:hypothetical protein n=1 Tax=uncultured Streptococcus sp. TaxID=83427 RepID=UPI0026013765
MSIIVYTTAIILSYLLNIFKLFLVISTKNGNGVTSQSNFHLASRSGNRSKTDFYGGIKCETFELEMRSTMTKHKHLTLSDRNDI